MPCLAAHRLPAGLGRANPPPPPELTLGPKASNALRMFSLLSPSSPGVAETGVDGPVEAGKGIWLAETTGLAVGVGRGRPNAAGLLNAGAPKTPRFTGPELKDPEVGVGREDEWVGLLGGREDLRCDSVRSEMSEVSI
jgi:hypothetical protein